MKKIIALALSLIMVLSFASVSLADSVVAATNCAFPPYEFYDNGVEAGIDVEIVKAVCEKLGYDLSIVDTEFGSIIAGVATGKYDLGFGAITITEERAKSVHFTTSYATGIQSIIVKEDSPITGVDDLKADGIKVRVVSVPSEGLFRSQSKEYQQSVLPAGKKKFGMTAGLPVTLEGLVGADGCVWGLESFGFSAPYKVLDEKLGYTGQNVYEQVKKLLA